VRISTIQLRTASLARLREFYVDVLGFEPVDEEGSILALFSDINGDPLVTIEEIPGATPRPEFSTGLYHVAFLMPNRKELARILARLSEKRYPLQGFADHGVSEAIYLADPDGNGIELYADRPREEWPQKRGEIEMFTHPLDLENLLSEIGDTASEWDGIHPETTVGHIHLQVSNLEQSGNFYHDILGYDIVQKSFPGALFLSTGGYHHHVGLNNWNSNGASLAPRGSAGLTRFSVETADLITLRHLQVQFLHKGASFKEIPSENNSMPSLLVHDPDGLEIQIVVQQRVLVN
jgi:catechol 2,3-dioxygenase